MAKEGNKSQGPRHQITGSCDDCGKSDGEMAAVRRFSVSGKSRMVKLCSNCSIKV